MPSTARRSSGCAASARRCAASWRGHEVRVLYVAPRATRTPLNTAAVNELNAEARQRGGRRRRRSPELVLDAIGNAEAVTRRSAGRRSCSCASMHCCRGVVDGAIGSKLSLIKTYATAQQRQGVGMKKFVHFVAALLVLSAAAGASAQDCADSRDPRAEEVLGRGQLRHRRQVGARDGDRGAAAPCAGAGGEVSEARGAADLGRHRPFELCRCEGRARRARRGEEGALPARDRRSRSTSGRSRVRRSRASACCIRRCRASRSVSAIDKKARELLEQAVAISPDSIDTNYFLGEFLAEHKDVPGGIRHLEKALRGDGPSGTGARGPGPPRPGARRCWRS